MYSKEGSKAQTWPTPSVILIAVFVADVKRLFLGFLVDMISTVTLDVGIDNGHHLAPLGGYVMDHFSWVRELDIIPREVAVQRPRWESKKGT